MSFDVNRRRSYSARAAQFLEDEEVEWVSGDWIRDLNYDQGQDDYGINAAESMGTIRGWLRRHGFLARNSNRKQCGVCAEGALLLVLAEDPLVPDDTRGADLLAEFQTDAEQAYCAMGYGLEGWDSIPEFNDDVDREREEVVTLLRGMSKEVPTG